MSALFLLFNKKLTKEGNVLCEMHEDEIVLSVEYFVPGDGWPGHRSVSSYCLL